MSTPSPAPSAISQLDRINLECDQLCRQNGFLIAHTRLLLFMNEQMAKTGGISTGALIQFTARETAAANKGEIEELK